MSYTLGSLFDGSGGFPLVGALCGIEPKWAAEVEPYPLRCTVCRESWTLWRMKMHKTEDELLVLINLD